LPAHFHFPASYLFLLQLDREEIEAVFRERRGRASCVGGSRCHSNDHIGRARRPGTTDISCVRTSGAHPVPLQFDLWGINGLRALEHTGTHLRLAINHGHDAIHIRLPTDIGRGEYLAFEIPCGERYGSRARAAARANSMLSGTHSLCASSWRPPSQQLLLVRALIALDAHLSGASYRQTAEAVFGRKAVRERWTRDGTLKEQTRYLVRKARVLMARTGTSDV
jgi:hypothetical protein